jgi:N-methylhydantoinase A
LLTISKYGKDMAGKARLSVDIGGTFTDLVLLRGDGVSFSCKTSSTPSNPEDAVIHGLTQILDLSETNASDIGEVLHGTTVGSNTLLQKQGAPSGLITTEGFRDVLEIGRLRTPTMFDLGWDKPTPLIARRYRREVSERVLATGEVLRPLDREDVLAAGHFFRKEGIQSIAICFINSYKNPQHEQQAAQLLRDAFPDLAVTASVEVLPEAGEYERTSTTAVNAYVLPALRSYFARLEEKLRVNGVSAPLYIGNSNGGLSSAAVAQEKPVFFISSGRASGAVGAAKLGESLNEENLIVFDMGGTTASAALIHRGVLSRTNEYEFRAGMSVPSRFIKAGGYLMRVPTVDVAEVGNGAGSIAAVDKGRLITVGPISAGAVPGPACYGLGGRQPTVTDANVVLGFLPPALAGGALTLDVDAARAAIEESIGNPLGLNVAEAAFGIREIANANMVRAIRAVTIERGLDPRDLTLFAFGGSGPVHACDLAVSLGIPRVLFPPGPGVFTAMGMLASMVEHHELRSCQTPLVELDEAFVKAQLSSMEASASRTLGRQGYAEVNIGLSHEIDLRLQGQDSTLSVPLHLPLDTCALRKTFLAAYRDVYGYSPTDQVEAVQLRLQARGRSESVIDFRALRRATIEQQTQAPSTRKVYINRSWTEFPVISRQNLPQHARGPLIIESADTTIVIPAEALVQRQPSDGLLVDLVEHTP